MCSEKEHCFLLQINVYTSISAIKPSSNYAQLLKTFLWKHNLRKYMESEYQYPELFCH